MKTVDRLIISELVGPWLLGVSMFTVMIAAGQFLFQVTGYLAKGADFMMTMQFIFLLLPGIIAKTFSMAVLLGALLAFGRLSGDSEIVALRAAGISLAPMKQFRSRRQVRRPWILVLHLESALLELANPFEVIGHPGLRRGSEW